jgi:hypothetical protein
MVMKEIRLELGEFYSQGDEDRFFGVLYKIPAIKEIRGAFRSAVVLTLDPRKLSREQLIDLIAAARRYRLSRKPLKSLTRRFKIFDSPGWKKILDDQED